MSGGSQLTVDSAVTCTGTGCAKGGASPLHALLLKAQWPEEPTMEECALAPGGKALPCLANDGGAGQAGGEPAIDHALLSTAAPIVRPLWRGTDYRYSGRTSARWSNLL